MTTTKTERVRVSELKDDDIVVLGGVELQLTEAWHHHSTDATRLYFEGDGIGVNFQATGEINRVVKTEPVTHPVGTLVQCGDIIMVRTGKADKWIRVNDETDDDRRTGWRDKDMADAIKQGNVDLLFNPNDKEA